MAATEGVGASSQEAKGLSLTIDQLTRVDFLGTRYLAGEAGGSRSVAWAHTCELPDPWSWIGTGDLLMSNGYTFPAEADAQVDYLRQLLEAGVSGVAFSEDFQGPPLTPAAQRYADDYGLPILEVAHSVQFLMLAKTIADQNSNQASASLLRVLRVYDIYRRSHLRDGGKRETLLAQLSRETAAELHVVDLDAETELLAGSPQLREGHVTAVVGAIKSGASRAPTFTRIPADDGGVLIVLPLDTDGNTVLVAHLGPRSGQLDLVVLQHAAVVLQIEVDRIHSSQQHQSVQGSLLFQRLIDGNINLEDARSWLQGYGFSSRSLRVVQVAIGNGNSNQVARHLFSQGIPHLILVHDREISLLTEDWRPEGGRHILPQWMGAVLGTSSPVHNLARLADGLREAKWALQSAISHQEPYASYETSFPRFFPRTIAEGEKLVQDVLGAVFEYERDREVSLIDTLEAFFHENKSWVKAAARLGIHKQTLVYRIRKIESLTGRDLNSLQGQTEIYLATQAARQLRPGGANEPGPHVGLPAIGTVA